MNTGPPAPRTVEGRHLVLFILGLGLVLAGFGWWYHWRQVSPSLELWGSAHALRLRDAEQSEALRLGPAGEADEHLRIGEEKLAILQRKDASQTKGNPDVRRALLSDFAFAEPKKNGTPQWQFALQLRDETGVSTFAFSPATDQILLVETGSAATITPVARFVEAFFIRTLEGREPFDPPADQTKE